MSKRAIITGITGQDGSYLVDFKVLVEMMVDADLARLSPRGAPVGGVQARP